MLRNCSSIDTPSLGMVCPTRSRRKAGLPSLGQPLPSKIFRLLLLCLVLLVKVPVALSANSPRQQCMFALLEADENRDSLLSLPEFFAALSFLSTQPECQQQLHREDGPGGELATSYNDPFLSPFVETFYSLSCLCPSGVPRIASEPLCCPAEPVANTSLRIPTASDPDAYLDVFCWTLYSVLNEQCERDSTPALPAPEPVTGLAPTDAAAPTAEMVPPAPPTATSPTTPTSVMQGVEAEMTAPPSSSPTLLQAELPMGQGAGDNNNDKSEQADQAPFISNDDFEMTSAPSASPTMPSEQEIEQDDKVSKEENDGSNSTAAVTDSLSSKGATPKGNVDNGVTLVLSLALTAASFCLCFAALYWRYRVRSTPSVHTKKHGLPTTSASDLDVPTTELSAATSNSADAPVVAAGTDGVNNSVHRSVSDLGP